MKSILKALSLVGAVCALSLPASVQASPSMVFVEIDGSEQTFHWPRGNPHQYCGQGYTFEVDPSPGDSTRFTVTVKTWALAQQLTTAMAEEEDLDVILYFMKYDLSKKPVDVKNCFAHDAHIIAFQTFWDGGKQSVRITFDSFDSNCDPTN